MCDYVAGELLLSHHRDDPAAELLLEQIGTREIPHVTILERLETRLEKLGLSPRPDAALRFVRLGVPAGDETFKIGYLEFFYKHAVLRAMDERRFDFSRKVHQEILRSSQLHPQIAPNGLLSVAAATASAAPGTAFTFNATNGTYKQQVGWPGVASRGTGVRILLLDTGVDAVAAYNVVDGRNFIDDTRTQDVTDDHGHGTALASILHDVAPDAEIVVYKIADASGLASEWSLLGGLSAASGARVVNVSFAFGLGALACGTCGRASHSTRSGLFEAALAELVAAPDAPIIVAAAGNASQTTLAFPARYRDVLAVASVDGAGRLSGFTNRSTVGHDGQAHPHVFVVPGGAGPTVAAPTEYIGTSAAGTRHCGTSVAAAYASAMIARMWSEPARRHWTRTQMLAHVTAKASTRAGQLPAYATPTHGNGLMQCV